MIEEAPVVPSARQRLLCAIGIGLLCGAFAFVLHGRAGFWPDFVFPWAAAGHLLNGTDPYAALPGGLAEPFESPLLYPLPSVLAAVPLAGLTLPIAGAIFGALSAALLAYVVTREGWHRLWILGSAPFVMAINLGQFSPLVTVAALVPTLGFLALLKPNIGLAVFCARPSWRAAIGCTLLLAASIAVLPAWPGEWLQAVRTLPGHPAPILSVHGLGLVLLLAALRWRTMEGRLLLVSACVPQLLFFADQLPLWLVARTRRELLAMSGCSLVAFALWFLSVADGRPYVPAAQPFVLGLIYLPALVIVLRRPNEGDVPAWIERIAQGRGKKAARAVSPGVTRTG